MQATNDNRKRRILLAMLMMAASNPSAFAQGWRERRGRRESEEAADPVAHAAFGPEVRIVRDIAYGPDDNQRFDAYLPTGGARNAPAIFMVHGGGWQRGDKAMRSVVANKVSHWVSRGFVFISTNYRMLPQAAPAEQAGDVLQAVIAAQRRASEWGADPAKFILMGHSAGAHLVALLSAAPPREGAIPWRGAVLLDSAALDVVMTMEGRHLPLHDRAFGSDPAYWRRVSPAHHLAAGAPPMLAVASTQRRSALPQARHFAARAAARAVSVQVLEQALSHRDINEQLGTPGPYTSAVDAFISAALQ